MIEKTYRATVESIGTATGFVEAALEEAGCPMKTLMQISMAMDEMFGNIVRYGYGPGGGDVTVRFGVDEKTRIAQITLIDRAVPFNPLAVAKPDTTKPAEERPIGGLGIFLVRKTMDDMSYEHKDGCNILTMRKKI